MKISFLFLTLFFFSSCCTLDILGPRDKPDFQKMDWVEIKITYWINTGTKRAERTFKVDDPVTIAELKSKMSIKSISGLSTGAGDQIILRDSKGKKWQGNIVFEDALYLCDMENMWYSYKLEFSDYEFYKKIVNLSAQNEKQIHNEATSEHIIMRLNLSKQYPALHE